MKKLFGSLMLVLLASTCWAMEASVLGVVENGSINAKAKYYSFGGGGDAPFVEQRYISNYSAQGTGGFSFVGMFEGVMATQEQFELQNGVGHWETKMGTGTLINTADESGVVTGILTQNAVGFGGVLKSGMVGAQLATSEGLAGIAESQGIGTFRAGGIQSIMTGSTSSQPSIVQSFEAHWSFGPGQYQAQVKINFPSGQ